MPGPLRCVLALARIAVAAELARSLAAGRRLRALLLAAGERRRREIRSNGGQGFISRPVTGNRRAPVPVYRTGLTGYRSEPVEFKSKFK